MHLGHLQAYWSKQTYPEKSPDATLLEKKRQQILDGYLSLLNYALQFGYSFNVWSSIVNTMLEKDKGVPKIHRLWVIHLYKGDYNPILGVNGEKLFTMHHCKDT